jgi:hypothetical protein
MKIHLASASFLNIVDMPFRLETFAENLVRLLDSQAENLVFDSVESQLAWPLSVYHIVRLL